MHDEQAHEDACHRRPPLLYESNGERPQSLVNCFSPMTLAQSPMLVPRRSTEDKSLSNPKNCMQCHLDKTVITMHSATYVELLSPQGRPNKHKKKDSDPFQGYPLRVQRRSHIPLPRLNHDHLSHLTLIFPLHSFLHVPQLIQIDSALFHLLRPIAHLFSRSGMALAVHRGLDRVVLLPC
jgi:hypothetical protein